MDDVAVRNRGGEGPRAGGAGGVGGPVGPRLTMVASKYQAPEVTPCVESTVRKPWRSRGGRAGGRYHSPAVEEEERYCASVLGRRRRKQQVEKERGSIGCVCLSSSRAFSESAVRRSWESSTPGARRTRDRRTAPAASARRWAASFTLCGGDGRKRFIRCLAARRPSRECSRRMKFREGSARFG